MADRPHRVVVVGGSFAGYTVVRQLDDLGFDGEVVWVSRETETPYSRPPLSKEIIRGKLAAADIRLPTLQPSSISLTWCGGRSALKVNPSRRSIQVSDEGWIDFEALFVCTGAEPIVPRKLHGLRGVHVLRTLEDSLALRADLESCHRLLIVGGGFIGCELAASARQLGLEVGLIEQAPGLLQRALPQELAGHCEELQRQSGVDVHCGSRVSSLTGKDRVEGVRLEDGSVLDGDVVVIALGIRPAAQFLEGSGIALDGGVVCDATCAASADGIYAAGDVCRWFNPLYGRLMQVAHWTNALEQAQTAAHNFMAASGYLDREPKVYASVPYFWTDQFGEKIQLVGDPEGYDEVGNANGARPGKGSAITRYYRTGKFVAAAGVNSPREIMLCRREIAELAAQAAA